MQFDSYPGSDLTEIERYIETALSVIRFARKRDPDGIRRALHQLTNIATGWSLSAEIEIQEMIRQQQLEEEHSSE